MPTTTTNIANRALLRIGHTELISSLGTDETDGDQTVAAMVAREYLDVLRQEVLEAYPWHFATKRAPLATPVGATARSDWDYVFALPTDCRYVRGLVVTGDANPAVDERIPFTVEPGDSAGSLVLLCNEDAAEVLYTVDQTGLDVWIRGALNGYILLMAAEFALALRKDGQLALALRREAEALLSRAAALSLNQQLRTAEASPRAIRARG